DFDWVTARRNCSVRRVFESLQAQAKKNVEAMTPVTDKAPPFEFVRFNGGFAVIRRCFRNVGVRFWCSNTAIVVDDFGRTTLFTATVRMNDAGECRLLVNGDQLDHWQLLMRALEPLFFPTLDK